ncbi:MAG: cytochrome c [Gemmatimonadota bacterium]
MSPSFLPASLRAQPSLRSLVVGGALALLSACAGSQSSAQMADAPETPDGAAILRRACTACHALRGLSAYQDYWGEPEWRSMVETMVEYGAEVSPQEVPVLARWLAENYGTAGN